MQPLTNNWLRAKRRLASQAGARDDAVARRDERRSAGLTCEHSWVPVSTQETWSGPLHVSSCAVCHAVLQEWESTARRITS